MAMTEIYHHLVLCMLFSGTSSNYVRAAWNRAKSRMRLASRGLATLFYTKKVCFWILQRLDYKQALNLSP